MEEQLTTMEKTKSRPTEGAGAAPQLIDARIEELGDWRGETLARVRSLIRQADPDVVEEWKWQKPSNPLGVPVWSHAGIICTGETYKNAVKLTFAKGASWTTRQASSTPAWKATPGAPSTSTRARDRRRGVEGAHSRGIGAEHFRERPLAPPAPEGARTANHGAKFLHNLSVRFKLDDALVEADPQRTHFRRYTSQSLRPSFSGEAKRRPENPEGPARPSWVLGSRFARPRMTILLYHASASQGTRHGPHQPARLHAHWSRKRNPGDLMGHMPASGRYDSMLYRRSGRSGLKLPAISLGLWHNFGHDTPPSARARSCSPPSTSASRISTSPTITARRPARRKSSSAA